MKNNHMQRLDKSVLTMAYILDAEMLWSSKPNNYGFVTDRDYLTLYLMC